MSQKDSQASQFPDLPPLPTFEDSEEADAVPATSKKQKKKLDLADLSNKIEAELHKSDVYRKEEVELAKETTHDTKVESHISYLKKKQKATSKPKEIAKPPKPVLKSSSHKCANVKETVHEEASHHIKSDKPQKVATVAELDSLHKRQQEYFSSLRARLDHETRERQEQIKQKQRTVTIKEGELLKWEKALLAKEKKIAAGTQDLDKAKKMEQKLEDEHISVKYEKAKVAELQKQLTQKERKLKLVEKELLVKQKQLHELAEELVTRGATIEKHTEAELDHFVAQEQSMRDQYAKDIEQAHVKQVAREAPKEDAVLQQTFSKKISPSKQVQYDLLRSMILDCYDSIANQQLEHAASVYAKLKTVYVEYTSEFGPDAQLHTDLLTLHKDLSLQMTQ